MADVHKNATPAGGQQLPTPPGFDVEGGTGTWSESAFRGLSGVEEWKKVGWMKKGVIVLRAIGLLFSFLSFMLMVVIDDFTNYDVGVYVFVIALFAMVYTAVQSGIKIHLLRTGKATNTSTFVACFDFSTDTILVYLLLSSASAAAAITVPFHGSSHANTSIIMSFLAFFCLSPSSFISGYLLAAQLST